MFRIMFVKLTTSRMPWSPKICSDEAEFVRLFVMIIEPSSEFHQEPFSWRDSLASRHTSLESAVGSRKADVQQATLAQQL